MPQLLTTASIVMCAHGGKCTCPAGEPRVRVSGQSVIAQTSPWIVVGCAMVGGPGPGCQTATFVTGTVRVRAGGKPLLMDNSVGLAAPSAAPVTVVANQPRVRAR